MIKHIRRHGAPLMLCMLAACTVKEASKSDTTLAADTSLNRDLRMANADSAAQPQLNDVPVSNATTPVPATPAQTPMRTTTPAPRTPVRAPARTTTPVRTPVPSTTTTASGNTVTRNPTGTASSSGGGSVGTIASGTTLSLRSNARVCTDTYKVGQTFTATTTESVTGSNGATIPAGATVSLEVTQLKRSENINDKIVMEFAVRSLSFGGRSYPLSGDVASADIDRVRNQPKSNDVKKVVGGAVIGAIAGQILGKNTKSTIIGAGAGAAAGAGAVAATSNFEGCVGEGNSISIRLTGPVQIRV